MREGCSPDVTSDEYASKLDFKATHQEPLLVEEDKQAPMEVTETPVESIAAPSIVRPGLGKLETLGLKDSFRLGPGTKKHPKAIGHLHTHRGHSN